MYLSVLSCKAGDKNVTHDVLLCEQEAVSDGGPLLAVLGFLILPLIWSVPEALITAELATAFPENSGYVAWVTAAFGPFWGFQVASLMARVDCLDLVFVSDSAAQNSTLLCISVAYVGQHPDH